MANQNFRVNQQIKASQVRLLNDDGTQVGVVSLTEALTKANDLSTDLVEIAPSAQPPVVKLIDFKKFRYQLSKKEAAEKRKQKGGDLKEIRLTPYMAENDFQTRIRRGEEFLSENNKVRVVLRFERAFQLAHKEIGYEMLAKAAKALEHLSQVESEPKMIGRQILMTLTPVKKSAKITPA